MKKLCHVSIEVGEKDSRKTATDSTPRSQAKRPRLSLDASGVEASDEVSHSDIQEKYTVMAKLEWTPQFCIIYYQ